MAQNKVLFIGSYLSKHRGSVGPTELLAKYLNQNNFKVTLASSYSNRLLRLLDTVLKLLFYSGNTIYIDVYSGNAFRIAEISAFIGRLRSKQLIFMLHGGALHEFLKNNTSRVKTVFQNQLHIYSPSRFIINEFKAYDIQVNYQPNGVDLSNFPFAKSSSPSQLSLLWVRAFDNIYNPDVAIKILNALKEEYSEATLTMVGPDRGMLNDIKKLIAKFKLENSVNIIGSIKNELLHQYYQTHSVLVNTTSYESFGVSLIEAASCGIPIVSNNVGEINYIWKHGYNIRLVENNNVHKFTTEIKLLIQNNSLREDQINRAKQNTTQFNNQLTNTFWYNLLNNL
jgi:glycosyltransferase involved in cell wall biosynthesis